MKSILLATFALLLIATPSLGVMGVDDHVPASTLIVPFFEVGIDVAQNPHDTLPIVYNKDNGVTVHWEVYTRDGVPVFSGNQSIGTTVTWNGSMRDLINNVATVGERAMLVDGDFYRGFMTIDLVTAATDLSPFDASYPFSDDNSLLGYTYYLRLAEGSANGLPMIHLESSTEALPARILGFYSASDNREEIDLNARDCAETTMLGEEYSDSFCNSSTNLTMRVRNRVFRSDAVGGKTRIILFTWDTSRPAQGGPSAICDANPGLGCPTEYAYNSILGNGSSADSGDLELSRVVNIIEAQGSPVGSGEFVILALEDPGSSMQVFSFAFNSAQPAGNPNINWDAIFPGSIDP